MYILYIDIIPALILTMSAVLLFQHDPISHLNILIKNIYLL